MNIQNSSLSTLRELEDWIHGQFPKLNTVLDEFPSGAAMLDITRGEESLVVQQSPTWGEVVGLSLLDDDAIFSPPQREFENMKHLCLYLFQLLSSPEPFNLVKDCFRDFH